jgi:dTDP-4-dehydrorhamnose 3,5-epimerase
LAAGGIGTVLGMARRGFDKWAADPFTRNVAVRSELARTERRNTVSGSMERLPTRLDGLVLLAPTVHGDARGFFVETYRADAWAAEGVPTEFVQDNHSRSRRGTLRGIHFQTHPGQGKLVRVARGRVFDVVVDLRRGSPTFGEWEGIELDDEHGLQLYIPVGFGHGFCVLSETADFVYKCTAYYDAATEAGIRFDDPDVGVRWPAGVELLYSERDREAPRLADVAASLPFRYEG